MKTLTAIWNACVFEAKWAMFALAIVFAFCVFLLLLAYVLDRLPSDPFDVWKE